MLCKALKAMKAGKRALAKHTAVASGHPATQKFMDNAKACFGAAVNKYHLHFASAVVESVANLQKFTTTLQHVAGGAKHGAVWHAVEGALDKPAVTLYKDLRLQVMSTPPRNFTPDSTLILRQNSLLS